MEGKIAGYRKEWIRYGYFEFTDCEKIKPNQRVIVQKKVEKKKANEDILRTIFFTIQNGDLVTGPGVRHIVIKGSGSDPVSPPQLSRHGWKNVFIQSKDGERELNPGTKYLFCETTL